ncbi:hypothetical protein PtrSN002B_012467, partial [Pyrenophora tritici-repentis]
KSDRIELIVAESKCRLCRTASIAYPFHLRCLSTFEQYLYGHDLLEDDDWPLRCAQVMAPVPIPNSPTSRSLVNVLHGLFQKVMSMVSPLTPLAPLLDGLPNLPCELQELVFSFMLDSPGGCVLFNQGTLDVLEKLLSWPERRH